MIQGPNLSGPYLPGPILPHQYCPGALFAGAWFAWVQFAAEPKTKSAGGFSCLEPHNIWWDDSPNRLILYVDSMEYNFWSENFQTLGNQKFDQIACMNIAAKIALRQSLSNVQSFTQRSSFDDRKKKYLKHRHWTFAVRWLVLVKS